MTPADLLLHCNDIRKRIKPFFEDLLAGGEYEAFVDHLERCAPCKKYVRSLGDLSNQIWKLGQISVPVDLRQTAFYKLNHPDPVQAKIFRPVPNPVFIMLLSLPATALIVFLIARAGDAPRSKAPTFPKTALVRPQASTDDQDGLGMPKNARSQIPREETASFMDEAASRKLEPLQSDKKESASQKDKASLGLLGAEAVATSEAPGKAGNAQKPQAPEVGLLMPEIHLHANYLENKELTTLKERKRQLQSELQSYAKQLAKFKTKSQNLESATLAQQQEFEDELARLERDSKIFKEDNRRVDAQIESAAAEREDWEIRHRQKVADEIRFSGSDLESQPSDLLVFSAPSETLARSLQSAYLLYSGEAAIEDFTKNVRLLPHERQFVSIYTRYGKKDPLLHWHLLMNTQQITEFFDFLNTAGGSVAYREGRVAVCYIPKREIDALKVRLRAMRVSFEEYGAIEPTGTVLSTTPAVISIFFMEPA